MSTQSQAVKLPEAANAAFKKALDEFLSSLPQHGRDQFTAMGKDDSGHASSPEVIVTAAHAIDIVNRQKSRTRSFGQRYRNIIESLQSFFVVIDTAVSSNPTIPALVWAGVRFVLEVAKKYFAFFESITSSLETVADDLKFYNDYAITLYTKWESVQTALVKVYIGILKLCNEVRVLYKQRDGRDRNFSDLAKKAFGKTFWNNSIEGIMKEILSSRESIEREVKHVERMQAKVQWGKVTEERVRAEAAREDAERERLSQAEARRIEAEEYARQEEERKRQEQEREKQEQERIKQEQMRNEEQQREKTKLRNNFVRSLRAIDQRAVQEEIKSKALEESGIHFLRHKDFISWYQSPNESSTNRNVFWCHGKPGSGKTVLAALTIDAISKQAGDDSLPPAFFYLRFTERSRRTTASVKRAILHQLFLTLSESDQDTTVDEFLKENRVSTVPEGADVESVILRVLDLITAKVFIVIDGLDECDDLSELMKFIVHIRVRSRILVFSREWDVHIGEPLRGCLDVALDDPGLKQASEIERFIRATVNDYCSRRMLVVDDEHILDEIVDTLTRRADGMWLWVTLQIETLCRQQRDADIRAALDDLPRTLDATYLRILHHIQALDDRPRKLVKYALELLIAALRPLGLEELAAGVSLACSLDNPSEGYSSVNVPKQLIDNSFGLYTIRGDPPVVQLVHASVRDYLIKDPQTLNQSETLSWYHVYPLDHLQWRIVRLCFEDARLRRNGMTIRPFHYRTDELGRFPKEHLKMSIPHLASSLASDILTDEIRTNLAKWYPMAAYRVTTFQDLEPIYDSLRYLTSATQYDSSEQQLIMTARSLHMLYRAPNDYPVLAAASEIYRCVISDHHNSRFATMVDLATVLYQWFEITGNIMTLRESIGYLKRSASQLENSVTTVHYVSVLSNITQYESIVCLHEGNFEGFQQILTQYTEILNLSSDNDMRLTSLKAVLDVLVASVSHGRTIPSLTAHSVAEHALESALDKCDLPIPDILETSARIKPWHKFADAILSRRPCYWNFALATLCIIKSFQNTQDEIRRRVERAQDLISRLHTLIREVTPSTINLYTYLGRFISGNITRLESRFDALPKLKKYGQLYAEFLLDESKCDQAFEILEATQPELRSNQHYLEAIFDTLSDSTIGDITSFDIGSSNTVSHFRNILANIRGVPDLATFPFSSLSSLTRVAQRGHVVLVLIGNDRLNALLLRQGGHTVENLDLSETRDFLQKVINEINDNAKALRTSFFRFHEPPGRLWAATLRTALELLWDHLASPIFLFLKLEKQIPSRRPRLFWCFMGEGPLLPVHAATDYGSRDGSSPEVKMTTTSDYVVSSYIPCLSALHHGDEKRRRLSMDQGDILLASVPRSSKIPYGVSDTLHTKENVDKRQALPNLPAFGPCKKLHTIQVTWSDFLRLLLQSDIAHISSPHSSLVQLLNHKNILDDTSTTAGLMQTDPCRPIFAFLALHNNGYPRKPSDMYHDVPLDLPVGMATLLAMTNNGYPRELSDMYHAAPAMLDLGISSVVTTMWNDPKWYMEETANEFYEYMLHRRDGVFDLDDVPYALDKAMRLLRKRIDGLPSTDQENAQMAWVTSIHMGI